MNIYDGGSRIHVSTENWSHGIKYTIHGLVERFDRIGESQVALGDIEIRGGEVFDVLLPATFDVARLKGRDRDYGLIDLVIERNVKTGVLKMPRGEYGGLEYLGSSPGKAGGFLFRFVRQ